MFVQGRSEDEKVLLIELHCLAYKLYPPEWQLGSHLRTFASYVGQTLNKHRNHGGVCNILMRQSGQYTLNIWLPAARRGTNFIEYSKRVVKG